MYTTCLVMIEEIEFLTGFLNIWLRLFYNFLYSILLYTYSLTIPF